MKHFHTRLVFAGADAEEGNTVAVLRIHVCLNLEHKARELGFIGFNHTLSGVARLRRWSPIYQGIQHVLDTEVVDTGAEENRCLGAFQEPFKRERLTGALNEFDAFANVIHFQRKKFVEARIAQSFDHFNVVGEFSPPGVKRFMRLSSREKTPRNVFPMPTGQVIGAQSIFKTFSISPSKSIGS